MKLRFNLQAKLVLGVVLLISFTCLVIGIATVYNVRGQLSVALTEKAKSDTATTVELLDVLYPGAWSVQNGELYKGAVKINDNNELVDRIARLTGNTVTFFLQDARIATNIVRDGARAVGTKAADNVAETVLTHEQVFRGEANVLDVKYQAMYTPIKNAAGKTIGMVYMGVSKKFTDELEQGFLLTFAGVAAFSLLFFSLLGWYFGRKVVRQIVAMEVVADKIASGDVSVTEMKGLSNDEIGRLGQSFLKISASLRSLVDDTRMLVQAAVNGDLSKRADETKHEGDYRKIVEGMNDTLDATTAPVKETAVVLKEMAEGNLGLRVTGNYQGDHAAIKVAMNATLDTLAHLMDDTNQLAKSAIHGDLATRIEASRHKGDFRVLVNGINQTLDATTAPIKEAAAVLAEMAEGNLRLRMEGDYQGDHAAIKKALNATIDSLSAYIGEISTVLSSLAEGNLSLKAEGEFRGDFIHIKRALNETIEALGVYIHEIAGVLTEMSNSNLDVGIQSEYKGEFIQIKEALNLIVETFNRVFSDIHNAADEVTSGAQQVAEGSQTLSQGATEQAGSIEELTVSTSQVATQTKDNAMNANRANELALTARETAERGNEHMKDMLSSMTEISQSSSNIYKIIKVIDEIAFQTNILALNAAVEAARAGQHGKGFAVVAEEVRNLAARSAQAAKETTALIEGSMKNVENGTKIAHDTAQALDEIVNGVAKAAALVSEIAADSNEQATAISQISKGIEQVSQVVQTNSATAQESAAASEELSGQARLLKDMMSGFTLKTPTANIRYEMRIPAGKRVKYAKNAAPAEHRPVKKIVLSDREFGKY